eukprot:2178199-Pleurochrysis_carterae.AAC.1
MTGLSAKSSSSSQASLGNAKPSSRAEYAHWRERRARQQPAPRKRLFGRARRPDKCACPNQNLQQQAAPRGQGESR